MRTQTPLIAITAGDAAGIGPEVVAKAVRVPEVRQACVPLIVGDVRIFVDPRFAALLPEATPVTRVFDAAALGPASVPFLDLKNLDPAAVTVGSVCSAAGRAAVEFVIEAARLALAHEIDAIATAPLNKEAIRAAGIPFIGHTEILADSARAPRVTTLLATRGLRVTHVTRHVALSEVSSRLTVEAVLDTIALTHDGMQMLGLPRPRIAVAGLNPHNGDGGLLDREEIDVIAPAVARARDRGIDAAGPIPADSVFFLAIRGDFTWWCAWFMTRGTSP